LKHVTADSVVAELYSGIGVIGLNAASTAKEVFCSDSNEFVDDIFDECVDSLPAEHRDKVFYENLPAAEAVAAGQCDLADILIVDPPRKGLDADVLALLVDKHPSKKADSKCASFLSILSSDNYCGCGQISREWSM
jgi:23S rRNA (uracil1939-C5)-methyltransferase